MHPRQMSDIIFENLHYEDNIKIYHIKMLCNDCKIYHIKILCNDCKCDFNGSVNLPMCRYYH